MKKITAVLLTITLFLTLFSCQKDNSGLVATVEVTVYDVSLTNPLKGETVYLMMDEIGLNPKPADAVRRVNTNADGIATFRLNINDLNIVEMETRLVFMVFFTYQGLELRDSKEIKVKRGENNPQITLKIIK